MKSTVQPAGRLHREGGRVTKEARRQPQHVTDAGGEVAAVSLMGRSTHAAIDRLAPAVRTAAFGISRSINH